MKGLVFVQIIREEIAANLLPVVITSKSSSKSLQLSFHYNLLFIIIWIIKLVAQFVPKQLTEKIRIQIIKLPCFET